MKFNYLEYDLNYWSYMKYLEIRQCSYISTFMFLVSLILNKHFVLIKKTISHSILSNSSYDPTIVFFFFQLCDLLNLLSQFTADSVCMVVCSYIGTNAVCQGPLTKKTDSFPRAVIIPNRFSDRDWSLSKKAHYPSML